MWEQMFMTPNDEENIFAAIILLTVAIFYVSEHKS